MALSLIIGQLSHGYQTSYIYLNICLTFKSRKKRICFAPFLRPHRLDSHHRFGKQIYVRRRQTLWSKPKIYKSLIKTRVIALYHFLILNNVISLYSICVDRRGSTYSSVVPTQTGRLLLTSQEQEHHRTHNVPRFELTPTPKTHQQ